jgi:cyclopropane-fatty-acyl-phospholipid synthase
MSCVGSKKRPLRRSENGRDDMSFRTRIDSTLRRIDGAKFAIEYWDGEVVIYGGSEPEFTLSVRTAAVARRVLQNLLLHLPEAYVDGGIELRGDLQPLLELCYKNDGDLFRLSAWQRFGVSVWLWLQRNSRAGSRRNIAHHYNLGNDFFALWLDKGMVYSGAYFKNQDDDLDTAQHQKLRHLCTKLRLEPGQRLLDIGCGWGALALHAAHKHGVEMTGITLSEPQQHLSQAKVREFGLDHCVRVRLQDYRELGDEQFDRVVSVGMMEHVGRAFLPTYMAAVARSLRPGGTGVFQTMGRTTQGDVTPWITKYIFPGMYLPTLGEISDHMSASDLHIVDVENLRDHYALTLARWIERFESNVEAISCQFDERFVRMWRTYLNIACAGFRFGDLNLWQVTFTRGPVADVPLTRQFLYEA